MQTSQEVLDGGRLKGGMFRSHVTWIREKQASRLDELWSRLSPDPARTLSGVILATSWYPFAWLVEMDRNIEEMFGGEQSDVLRELGRFSARINLSTTYKVFDRDTNHAFFENSALLHSQFQDFGHVEYVRSNAGGRMIHRDYPCYSRVFCGSALGYYEATILSHGARRSLVEETECQCFGAPSCTFEMKWI
jgi:hypothetical protein